MGACHGTSATVDVDHRSTITPPNINVSRYSNPTEGTSTEHPSTSDVSIHDRTAAVSVVQSSASATWQLSFRNEFIVDPADIISVLDERAFHVINKFTSAEVLQIQRHVRAITRAIRGMPAASALMNMGRTPTASSLLPNTKTGLNKHCMDEAVLRRIFASGADHFQRGLTELSKLKKKRNAISSLNTSKSDSITEQTLGADGNTSFLLDNLNPSKTLESQFPKPFLSGKYKADPVGSIYLLLLACTEARWESYAAACVAASSTASGTSTSSSLDGKRKSFRNGTSETSNPDDGSNSVPAGVSFFILCYFMAMVVKSTNRDQKLLLLFHTLVPPKQLKSIFFQQQSSNLPKFPSYMFEIGFTSQVEQPYLSVTSEDLHPSKLGLKVSSAVALDTIASLLLIPMYGADGADRLEAGDGKGDLENLETISQLNALYESFSVDQLLSYDDFIHWASVALDDDTIDSILQSLFTAGIFISPERELHLVRECWLKWQREEYERHNFHGQATSDEVVAKTEMGISPKKKSSVIWGRVNGNSLDPPSTNGSDISLVNDSDKKSKRVWGGIGNFDGLGGLGNGILYCIDIHWWKSWENYTGWQWGPAHAELSRVDDRKHKSLRPARPRELSTESLLQKDSELIGGALGSYEVMKIGLRKNIDYVLVPCFVWDLLFELYGGGPPLPRMVDMPNNDDKITFPDSLKDSVFPIPESLTVVTHPWIIHCQVCDPIQPYRRGNAGSFTIRVMVSPDQPFWRFFAEIVLRLPVNHPRARDSNGKGKARLWRKVEYSPQGGVPTDVSGACRYGPWSLLCKGRSVEFPVDHNAVEIVEFQSTYQSEWLKYADHATIESSGLNDGMEVMFEYSLVGKDGAICWPREAAAKAGRARRLAEEDSLFRLKLQSLDDRGNPSNERIIGTVVDAMDFTGRWYPAEIVAVEKNNQRMGVKSKGSTQDENSEFFDNEEDIEKTAERSVTGNRRVKIDFGEALYLEEWIDVNSDRLAVAGRYTSDGIKNLESHDDAVAVDSKSAGSPVRKNGVSNTDTSSVENAIVCPFPGYGACGLVNLGNTCYMSVALQCLSYIPFFRAYLLSSLYKSSGDLNKDNPLGTGGKILEELSELMRLMWSGRYGARSPTRFRALLAKTLSQFVGTEQQDAQEVLNALIDSLHEDSNRIKNKPIVPPLDDEWLKKTDLSRVGREAWRRFLRRNRSIVTDTTMGQVLNRVECRTCGHASLNFDPFNMLSVPFPSVTDLVFRCLLVRRGSSLNCPALCKNKRSTIASTQQQHILEAYTFKMPRLADISDVKHHLQTLSGVAADRLRLWKGEKINVSHHVSRKVLTGSSFVKISVLPNKEGPCVQLTKQSEREEVSSSQVNEIYAFEETLNLRLIQASQVDSNEYDNDDEDTVASDDADHMHAAYRQRIRQDLLFYGDKLECFMVDSDPSFIARAVSRSLWPQNGLDFKLGLRVDAIDQRGHWFPGSVVEISEIPLDDAAAAKNTGISKRVRLHFDNFSSKWDEWYDFSDFCNSQVTPLYSHSTPRMKPIEVIAYHRLGMSLAKNVSEAASGYSDPTLFGQTFCIQFFNEWSTARAGAHILAQAARFLRSTTSELSSKLCSEKMIDALELATLAIAETIDVLVESELHFIKRALSRGKYIDDVSHDGPFDAAAMTNSLSEKLGSLLPRLPFDVRVCSVDSLTGTTAGVESEETAFPFSLVRTVGNYLNTRSSIVLHWRTIRLDKSSKRKSSSSPESSPDTIDDGLVAYRKPVVRIHPNESINLKPDQAGASDGSPGNSDEATLTMNVGVCLTEFCREQNLALADCWYCSKCKDLREGLQSMSLWRLPDILILHIKRFNCSARWREKISTNISFPLTGLNMSQWCDKESLGHQDACGKSTYDLIAVVNHLGGMTGGHYVAACKATPCSIDGSEELAHNFNGAGSNGFSVISLESMLEDQSVWRLPVLGKDKDGTTVLHQSRVAANASARAVSESSEPLWLHFDDDLVEPIPPKAVVSEMAYVLFYRRRELSSSNIARYSTLD